LPGTGDARNATESILATTLLWLYYFSIILLKHQVFPVIGFALPRGMHIGEDLS
jgi:hypothetical protein